MATPSDNSPEISTTVQPLDTASTYARGLLGAAFVGVFLMWIVPFVVFKLFGHDYLTAMLGGAVLIGIWAATWYVVKELSGRPSWYIPAYLALEYSGGLFLLIFLSPAADILTWAASFAPLTSHQQTILTYLIGYVIAMMPGYAVEQLIVSARRLRKSRLPVYTRYFVVCCTVVVVMVVVCALSYALGTGLKNSHLRSLNTIHLPSNAQFVTSLGNQGEHSKTENTYMLAYLQVPPHQDQPYSSTLIITNLQETTIRRDQRSICKSVAWPNCFVIGNFKYTFLHSDDTPAGVPAQIAKAIAAAPGYTDGCFYDGVGVVKPSVYCRAQDTAALTKLNDDAAQKTMAMVQKARTPQNLPNYTPAGSLYIKEWGITLPLPDQIKDAYYRFDANVIIGLRSYDSDGCFADVHQRAGATPLDRKVYGKGIASVDRVESGGFLTFPGQTHDYSVVINGYRYYIHANSDTTACTEMPQSLRAQLPEIFEWVQVHTH
jgi:hypothetical protein